VNEEVKQQWITALRSGNYPKGRGKLRGVDGTFCCMGVLCDLYDSTRWLVIDGYNVMHYERPNNHPSTHIAPPEIERWAGLHTINQSVLGVLNDASDDFDSVIVWIESNL
jgi:hypothetical protein